MAQPRRRTSGKRHTISIKDESFQQINQRSLVSERNLQSDPVRLLDDSLDLGLDNRAPVHVDLDVVDRP
jgi:hypothetical protein